ncbi:MAG: cytochrome c oxidase subunit II [Anaeromyxobacter sp.]
MTRLPLDAIAALQVAAPGYLPARASTAAGAVDSVFLFIFWVSAFFLALILLLTVLFVVKYRKRPGREAPEASPSHSTKLELFWSVIPLALVMAMFVMSARAYVTMTQPEGSTKGALKVGVTAKKWSWWFDHPEGKGAPDLHLVVNRPAELVLSSMDVIHSLYVAEFRLKQDAVPGRFTRMIFTPTVAGTYPILCTEFCGTDHSRMLSQVVVHPTQASYDAWAKEGMGPDVNVVEAGKKVFLQRGCVACHSTDGSRKVGPTVKGLYGHDVPLADGTTVKADDEYIRESLQKPGAKVVAGFPNVMPPAVLPDADLKALIAYLESLATDSAGKPGDAPAPGAHP